MVRYQLTLSSSTRTHLHSEETFTEQSAELWRATRTAMRRLMARRLIDPAHVSWDQWGLRVIEPDTGVRRLVAHGGVNTIGWQDPRGLRTGTDGHR